MNLSDTAQVVDHRAHAEKLLEQGLDVLLARAQAEATLAQADAIDRLTAALERMELPALTVTGSVLKGTCRIQTVKR